MNQAGLPLGARNHDLAPHFRGLLGSRYRMVESPGNLDGGTPTQKRALPSLTPKPRILNPTCVQTTSIPVDYDEFASGKMIYKLLQGLPRNLI